MPEELADNEGRKEEIDKRVDQIADTIDADLRPYERNTKGQKRLVAALGEKFKGDIVQATNQELERLLQLEERAVNGQAAWDQVEAALKALEARVNRMAELARLDANGEDIVQIGRQAEADTHLDEATDLVNLLASHNIPIDRFLSREEAAAIRRLMARHPNPDQISADLESGRTPDVLLINESQLIERAIGKMRQYTESRLPKALGQEPPPAPTEPAEPAPAAPELASREQITQLASDIQRLSNLIRNLRGLATELAEMRDRKARATLSSHLRQTYDESEQPTPAMPGRLTELQALDRLAPLVEFDLNDPKLSRQQVAEQQRQVEIGLQQAQIIKKSINLRRRGEQLEPVAQQRKSRVAEAFGGLERLLDRARGIGLALRQLFTRPTRERLDRSLAAAEQPQTELPPAVAARQDEEDLKTAQRATDEARRVVENPPATPAPATEPKKKKKEPEPMTEERIEKISQNAIAQEKARFIERRLAELKAARIGNKKWFAKLFESWSRKGKRADIRQAREEAEQLDFAEIGRITEQAIKGWTEVGNEAKSKEMAELYEMVAKKYGLEKENKPKNKLTEFLVKWVGPAAIGAGFRILFGAATGITGLPGAAVVGGIVGAVRGGLAEKRRLHGEMLGYEGWKQQLAELDSDQAKLEAMRSLTQDRKTFDRYFKGKSDEAFKFMIDFMTLSKDVDSQNVASNSFAEKILKNTNKEIQGKVIWAGVKSGLVAAGVSAAVYELLAVLGVGAHHPTGEQPAAGPGQAPAGAASGPGLNAPETHPPISGPGEFPGGHGGPGEFPQGTPEPGTAPAAPGVVPPVGAEQAPAITHPETPHQFDWRPDHRLEINSHTGEFSEGTGHDAIVHVDQANGATAEDIAKVVAKDIQHGQTGEHFNLTHDQTLKLADELSRQVQAEHAGQAVFGHDSDVTLSARAVNDAMERLGYNPPVLDSHDIPLNPAFGTEPIPAPVENAFTDIQRAQPEAPLDYYVDANAKPEAAIDFKKIGIEAGIAVAILAPLLYWRAREVKAGRTPSLKEHVESIRRKWDSVDKNIKAGRLDRAADRILAENDEPKALAFVNKVMQADLKLFKGDEPVELRIDTTTNKIRYWIGERANLPVSALDFTKLLSEKVIVSKQEQAKKEKPAPAKPEKLTDRYATYLERAKSGTPLTPDERSSLQDELNKSTLAEVNAYAREALRLSSDDILFGLASLSKSEDGKQRVILKKEGGEDKKYQYLTVPDKTQVALGYAGDVTTMKFDDFKRDFLDGKIKIGEE